MRRGTVNLKRADPPRGVVTLLIGFGVGYLMWGERAHRAIEEVDAMKMRQAQQADELRKLKEELAAERDRRAAGTAARSPDDHSCVQTASASLASIQSRANSADEREVDCARSAWLLSSPRLPLAHLG